MRNIAIIAHVDHGKTTLVNELLKQATGTFSGSMDCNEIESERGITILSKATRLYYKDHLLNIVDTPGHADFGGEVERIMSMVDGVALVVDHSEGPRTQTRFVLQKALNIPHVKPLIFVNKVDKKTTKGQHEIDNEIFDLFCALEANDSQMEFSTLYGSAKEGWCNPKLIQEAQGDERNALTLLLDRIIEEVPPPQELREHDESSLSMLVTTLEHIPRGGLGMTASGKIYSGTVKKGDKLVVKGGNNEVKGYTKVKEVSVVKGIEREELQVAGPGDIVSVSLVDKDAMPAVTDTLAGRPDIQALPYIPVDPPVISVKMTCNTSPLAGLDGKNPAHDELSRRLIKEGLYNTGIEAVQASDKTSMEVRGRGELQLAILVEQMRREGYELTLSPPSVIFKTLQDGSVVEPWEEVKVLLGSAEAAKVVDRVSSRGAEIIDMVQVANDGGGDKGTEPMVNMVLHSSTRCFAGMRSFIRDLTQGRAVVLSSFLEYRPKGPAIPKERRPPIVSSETGIVVASDMRHLSSNGSAFIGIGDRVYAGMIVGASSSSLEMLMNVTKEKAMEMTKKNKSGPIVVTKGRVSTEGALAYIEDDEQIEVTPLRICMRKKVLCAKQRKILAKTVAKTANS